MSQSQFALIGGADLTLFGRGYEILTKHLEFVSTRTIDLTFLPAVEMELGDDFQVQAILAGPLGFGFRRSCPSEVNPQAVSVLIRRKLAAESDDFLTYVCAAADPRITEAPLAIACAILGFMRVGSGQYDELGHRMRRQKSYREVYFEK